jgi:hypothetical protein
MQQQKRQHDWFAAYRRNRMLIENWATEATGATQQTSPRKSDTIAPPMHVAHAEKSKATRATTEIATPPIGPVAPVALSDTVRATEPQVPKSQEIPQSSILVARAAHFALDGRPRAQEAAEAELLAPALWFERATPAAQGEPDYEQPCAARCGRVEQRDGVLLHFCAECGAWGAYGYGVKLRGGQLGRWYCAAHRPRAGAGSSMGFGLEQPDVDGTGL